MRILDTCRSPWASFESFHDTSLAFQWYLTDTSLTLHWHFIDTDTSFTLTVYWHFIDTDTSFTLTVCWHISFTGTSFTDTSLTLTFHDASFRHVSDTQTECEFLNFIHTSNRALKTLSIFSNRLSKRSFIYFVIQIYRSILIIKIRVLNFFWRYFSI